MQKNCKTSQLILSIMDQFESRNAGVKIFGNSQLSERLSAYEKKAEGRYAKRQLNPHDNKIDLNDPSYGKPFEGSKTEARGRSAAAHIGKEVAELCYIIKTHGRKAPIKVEGQVHYEISFKELFDMYQVISNKVVGLLLRARKHNLVEFEGEMLFQRRDDHVLIRLLVDPGTIVGSQDYTSCVEHN